jgi:hypothetical protein
LYDDAYKQPDGASPPATEAEQQIANTRLAVRETLLLAADRVGGVDALEKWIRRDRENERIFWSVIIPKLLPLKVDSEVEMGARLAGLVATWLPPQ